ncbi:SPTB2 protein, partial [Baryphthengus martii]|nr:SPTB2 protein [Baryphthengus martii]
KPVQRSEPRLPVRAAGSPPTSPLSDVPLGVEQSWQEPSSSTPHSAGPSEKSVIWDPAETSTLLLPPRGPSGLGGTVNLILSIGKKGEKKKVQPVAGRSPLSPSLCSQVQVEAGKTSSTKRLPAVTCRPPVSSDRTPTTSHTLPKSGASSLFNSLQRRERARAEQARLLTLQGIMGASSLQATPEERHGPSNTWPQKCDRRKEGLGMAATGPQLGELLLYIRNPLARDIDAECGAAPRDPHLPDPKTTCPHLSLGSVLSLELPRDAVVLGCHRGDTTRQKEVEGQEQRQGGVVRPWEPTGTHGAGWLEEVDVDGHSPQQPSEGQGMSPKSERGTWFEEVSFNPSYSQQRAHHTGEERWSRRCPGSTSEDLLDSRPSQPSHIGMLHERVGPERDKLIARLAQDDSPSTTSRAKHHKAAWLELGSSPVDIPSRAGAIPGTAWAQRPAGNSQPAGSLAFPAASTQLSFLEGAQGSPQPPSLMSSAREICHPAHGQFEEEEEELQAIWEGAGEQRAPSPPAGTRARCRTGSGAGSLPSPDATTSRPLILSSTNNVLVAKFTLPTTARLLHSPSGEKSPSVGHSVGGSPSRHVVSPLVEELVSAAPSDNPGAWDRRRNGEEEKESTKAPPSKTEFQMMEGTLERKHVLQTGGRKASCRAWGLFHAVLMRQTLCFYQDRRDSLKSSVVALPLNLSGAVCTPDAEYTKKTNCFRLHLRDGSEYLLRAPSQPLMNEWVSKLQQNSGFPEVDYFQAAAAQRVEGTGSAGGFSKVPSPGSSHLQGHHQVTTPKSPEIVVLPRSNTQLQWPLGSQDGPADGAVAAAGDVPPCLGSSSQPRLLQWSPRGSPGLWDNSCPEDDYGLVANKRRSYSFTSATYQKITPVAVPKEPVEAGSSYSVTLYIGEQVAAVPRVRCHSFVARPATPQDTLGEKNPGPSRPKNKSVFKKFFGKKE